MKRRIRCGKVEFSVNQLPSGATAIQIVRATSRLEGIDTISEGFSPLVALADLEKSVLHLVRKVKEMRRKERKESAEHSRRIREKERKRKTAKGIKSRRRILEQIEMFPPKEAP